jgi:hypothetical protein
LNFQTPSDWEPLEFYESTTQFHLPEDTYEIWVEGYQGSILVAKSAVSSPPISITHGTLTDASFVLSPDITTGSGVLKYTLGWDGINQMPARAELLIEAYKGSDSFEPIPISSIPQELTVGSAPGTILLLDKAAGLVKLTGSLSLSSGQYRLTMTVTMDGAANGVSRIDIAHIYSGLTSSGLFFYGAGDLLSTVGVPSGATFITDFEFDGWPNATSVIGGVPGPDGTRMIMVIVPTGADPTKLKPIVDTVPGVAISSPAPTGSNLTSYSPPDTPPVYTFPEGDYSRPTSWTAVDKNGNTQQYTLVVNKAPSTDCRVTDFLFKEYPYAPVTIDETTKKITVEVPFGEDKTSLVPVISISGGSVAFPDGTPIDGSEQDFSGGNKTITVTAGDGSFQNYTLEINNGADADAEITSFVIDGYPGAVGVIDGNAGTIKAELPYGVSLTNLKPLIQFKGKTLEPASGLPRNFNGPVLYQVTAADNTTTRTYQVTLTNKPGNTDTGIFNFVITNVPNAKVVIGRNPRPEDGKIPIVIQVPYGTNEKNLIPEITLASSTSTISPASRVIIPFGNAGNNQEAVYTVTAQVPSATQQYVALVSQDLQYYYVNGVTGRDDWPDIYNGGSESYPFKTLAYAVYRASQHPTINKIFVSGELNNTTEGGAWERAADGPNGFRSSGGDAGSVFNLIGTGKPLTVTGVSNATLRGTAGKRVISLTGGAEITFENITLTGGNTSGDGGGIYISGNSKIKFSGGAITGNTARSGGGVYVNDDDPDPLTDPYDLTLVNSSVTGNTATGTAVGGIANGDTASFAGGGGIYISNYSDVWLAGGTVSNNITAGSGGGVLINGFAENIGGSRGQEYGLLMSGGTIANNRSNGGSSPHGGGGVYVAKGCFEMLAGEIKGNYSVRQGGGVVVWHNARFTASGTSSITNNEGVGSSKAICSRGVTEMMGKAQADKIYIWNNNPVSAGSFNNQPDSFTLAENARAAGIVLAYDDTPGSPQTRNFIIIAANVTGTSDPIARIDLEGHLTNYVFKDTNLNDWIGKKVLEGDSGLIGNKTFLKRFPLNTFVGGSTIPLEGYYHLEQKGTSSPDNIDALFKKGGAY